MKIRFFKSYLWVLGLSLALGFSGASCDDDDEDNTSQNLVQFNNVALTGAKEVPANQSQNTGTLNATYNKESNVLSYAITWSGFTPTGMHFHKGDPTVSGPVAQPVPTPHTSPKTGTLTLTAAEEADLLAGLWYINIHSAAFPGGEIRGQLVP